MLGLLYVAAQLRRSLGIEARIIDSNVDGLSLKDLETLLAEESPDIVGFSVLTFNLLNCIEVCKVLRRSSPDSIICFGGWHPTLYPEETLELGYADYVVIGEGELTFCELVGTLKEKNKENLDQKLSGIKGIGYKTRNGEIKINTPRELVKDLDELPFPAYDLIDTDKYSNLLASTGHLVNIMTSRGCPQKCIFCDIRRTPYRFRSPANIMEEIMPKTYLYRKLMEEGIIKHDYWLAFAKKPDLAFKTPFASPFFNNKELRFMQDSIQRQFYLNPKTILREIVRTRGLKQFLIKAKLALKMISP